MGFGIGGNVNADQIDKGVGRIVNAKRLSNLFNLDGGDGGRGGCFFPFLLERIEMACKAIDGPWSWLLPDFLRRLPDHQGQEK